MNANIYASLNRSVYDISACVFPTLWEYLLSLGTPREDVYFLGMCISGMFYNVLT